MKIAIIGGGIFGLTAFIKLREANYDCYLFEKNKNLLDGASTNNLNRIHMGYHYPRDAETIEQSKKGSKSFIKMYPKSIINNFENYYAISNTSLTSANEYEKALERNNLKYKKLKISNFKTKLKNMESLYKISEPIYSWQKIRAEIKKKTLKDKGRIILNTKINLVKKIANKYSLVTKNGNYIYDFIIDSSYEGSNALIKKILTPKKNIYQVTNVIECKITNFQSMGFALFDGPFFSFLPKGDYKNKSILLYHVKYSVLKKNISKYYNESWKNQDSLKTIIKSNNEKIKIDIKKYLPELRFKFIKNYISARVFLPENKKTEKRTSLIKKINKNYIKLFSGKVDHSVDIANRVLNILKKR